MSYIPRNRVSSVLNLLNKRVSNDHKYINAMNAFMSRHSGKFTAGEFAEYLAIANGNKAVDDAILEMLEEHAV